MQSVARSCKISFGHGWPKSSPVRWIAKCLASEGVQLVLLLVTICWLNLPRHEFQHDGIVGRILNPRIKYSPFFNLHSLTVSIFEANSFADQIIHDKVILLLDVSEDAKAWASSHSQACCSWGVQCHKNLWRRQGVGSTVEVEGHCRVGWVGNTSGAETEVQSIERSIGCWILHHRLQGLWFSSTEYTPYHN